MASFRIIFMMDAILSDNSLVTTANDVRLTQQVKAGGCASKLAPGTLSHILSRLPRQQDENLLVGFETSDDAGIYRIDADHALVQTVDFFTPMVDDPFTFGRIAATNALSDVYAMGGRAITALAIVCFPQDGDAAVLEEILRGGLSVMQEHSCVVLGGHSVRDNEIKFGYAVTGLADPARVLTNCGARPGDALVFTKAIGTGVITTAIKQGKACQQWIDAAIASMTTSNRRAAGIAAGPEFEVHAMTDVTGFGLIGHAREMAIGSGVRLELDVAALPLLEGALEAISGGCVPGGLIANREFAECFTEDLPQTQIGESLRTLLFDPQTAGGLLISVPQANAASIVKELRDGGYAFAGQIGQVLSGPPKVGLR